MLSPLILRPTMNTYSFFRHFYIAAFLISGGLAQGLVISDLDYEKDMPAIEYLLDAEWKNLFPMPLFNRPIVDKMFKYHHVGDATYPDKKLYIKTLKENAKVIGFVTYFYPNAQTIHIELLAIDKEHKGKGLGKKMVEWIMQEGKSYSTTRVQLYVYNHNIKAIKFYEHLGFSLIGISFGNYLLAKKIV